jgi:hypothetical protein
MSITFQVWNRPSANGVCLQWNPESQGCVSGFLKGDQKPLKPPGICRGVPALGPGLRNRL